MAIFIFTSLFLFAACRPMENEGGLDWATVEFSVDETSQTNVNQSVSGNTIKTALIIAVYDHVTSVGTTNYLVNLYDQQLQDLDNSTVSLDIPLNTKIRLAKIVFQKELTLEYIINNQPQAFCAGISEPFTVTGDDVSKIISVRMDNVLYSKDITFFSFEAENNPVLSSSVTGTIGGPFIIVTVPYGTQVTSLVASFSTSGQTVAIEDQVQTSGVTANDFTNNLDYSVFSACGENQKYTVFVFQSTSARCVLDYSTLDNCLLQ